MLLISGVCVWVATVWFGCFGCLGLVGTVFGCWFGVCELLHGCLFSYVLLPYGMICV